MDSNKNYNLHYNFKKRIFISLKINYFIQEKLIIP